MSSSSYENFDLLILPVNDGYQARVISSPAGQAHANFKVPFSAAELHLFTWLATSTLRHLKPVKPDEPCNAALDPKAFGKRLFQAVFADQLGKLLLRSYDLAQAKGHGLRIRLRMDQDAPELAGLPWEYLYVSDWSIFPALSDHTPIVRYVELNQPERPLPAKLPLRILTVVSNPKDVPQLQVEQEWTRLQMAVADLQKGERIVLERLQLPT